MYFCISAFVIISFVTLEEQMQTQTTNINTAHAPHLQVISCSQINRPPLRYTAQTNTNKHTTNLNTTHAHTHTQRKSLTHAPLADNNKPATNQLTATFPCAFRSSIFRSSARLKKTRMLSLSRYALPVHAMMSHLLLSV